MKITISIFILLCLFGCSNRLGTTDSPKTSAKEPNKVKVDSLIETPNLDNNPNTTTNSPQVILLEFVTIAKESYSGANKKENLVITNEKAWEEFWNKIYSTQFPKPKAPDIDFKKEILIGVLAGEFSTGGYSIEVIEIQQANEKINVKVKSKSPGPRCGVTSALTQPIHLVKMGKPDYKEIVFTESNHITNCKL
jgi:hypothetical protein